MNQERNETIRQAQIGKENSTALEKDTCILGRKVQNNAAAYTKEQKEVIYKLICTYQTSEICDANLKIT